MDVLKQKKELTTEKVIRLLTEAINREERLLKTLKVKEDTINYLFTKQRIDNRLDIYYSILDKYKQAENIENRTKREREALQSRLSTILTHYTNALDYIIKNALDTQSECESYIGKLKQLEKKLNKGHNLSDEDDLHDLDYEIIWGCTEKERFDRFKVIIEFLSKQKKEDSTKFEELSAKVRTMKKTDFRKKVKY